MKILLATILSIALLLGNSVNLRASVTGPVASDGDPASQAGQTCCQETAAIVGILQGSKGDAGQRGPFGPPCERDDSNQRVAFTVVRTSRLFTSASYTTRLPFEETVTLLPGTNFDLKTATFTCSVPGTYVFMFSVGKHPKSSLHLNVHLRKNGYVVVSGVSSDGIHFEQVSGSAVLVLQRGDTVFLTMHGWVYSDSYRYPAFSGFLLYPE